MVFLIWGDLKLFDGTSDTGMVGLGFLDNIRRSGTASAASWDGSTIVGRTGSPSTSGLQGFRWTEESGMVGLGNLPGSDSNDNSTPNAVSGDGSIIVGNGTITIPGTGGEFRRMAFIWDENDQMRSLKNVLSTDFGLEASLTGWTLTNATDLSRDGRTIIGSGLNPAGFQWTGLHSWMNLPNRSQNPAPYCCWGLALLALSLCTERRKETNLYKIELF